MVGDLRAVKLEFHAPFILSPALSPSLSLDRGAAPLERQFREIESPNIHFGERAGDRMKGA